MIRNCSATKFSTRTLRKVSKLWLWQPKWLLVDLLLVDHYDGRRDLNRGFGNKTWHLESTKKFFPFHSIQFLFPKTSCKFLSWVLRFGNCLFVGSPKDSFLQNLSQSMSTTSCSGSDGSAELEACRDESTAFLLKMVAIAAILTAGVAGVAIPLLGKNRRFLRTDSNPFFVAKAFAAGVILATGFVHMLPDATSALTDSCLPKYPWSKFPFSGFFAMISALATLLVDFVGTQYYERKQEKQQRAGQLDRLNSVDSVSSVDSGIVEEKERNGKVFGEEKGGGMHIVGIHAHAAHHRHNHPHGKDACEGHVTEHSHGSDVHSHRFGDGEEEGIVRHVVVSQVMFYMMSHQCMNSL